MFFSHTNADNVKLEAAFEEFAFNLGSNAIESDVALGHHRTLLGRHCSCHDELGRSKAWVCFIATNKINVSSFGLLSINCLNCGLLKKAAHESF